MIDFILFLSSTIDSKMSFLYWLVGIICIVAFLCVQFGLIFLVVKYRKRNQNSQKTYEKSYVTHNKKLEIIWTVLPSIILLVLFVIAVQVFYDIRKIPQDDALEIEIKARQWSWDYVYPQVTPAISHNSRNYCKTPADYQDDIPATPTDCQKQELEWKLGEPLRVPVNTKIVLKMTSNDVIHSFYIPQFHLKQDVLPGQYSYMWFEATEEGLFDVYCAEYCGTDHSGMISKVKVMSQKDFSSWLYSGGGEVSDSQTFSTEELIEKGAEVYQIKGCAACHKLNGENAVGPHLNNKYGKKEQLSDGSEVLIDENYLIESILQPNAKIVKGYPAAMPLQNVNEIELKALVEFIKSLK